MRIITGGGNISRLPWVLLANRGVFMCAAGWSVSISGKAPFGEYELPPSPRILIAAPRPVDVQDTRAEAHLEELVNLLSARNHLFYWDRHLRLAVTWEEFKETVESFQPQIVYYYGHGVGDVHNARLVFAQQKDNARLDKPVHDFALCLRNMAAPPFLVYMNCCKGDAAGFLGAGGQLSDFTPAVITNRTVAKIGAARAQAMALWESILLKGVSPHKAVASLYSKMGDLDLTTSDIRWMTPVIHCSYDSWKANPPVPPDRMVHDPYWHLKIDRVTQFSTIATQTRQMLREQKPKSLSFVWYGQEGQGIKIFHERLNVELREDLSNTFLYMVQPQWPAELSNAARSFGDMLTEAFEVNHPDDIPARIRSKTRGAFGKRALVYVRHQPVASAKLINPRTLRIYLEWWNAEFVPLLEKHQYALLGISFVVKNPAKFRRLILEKERIEELYLDKTVFRLLDEMEKLARRDLSDFLLTHNIRLPMSRRDQTLTRILEKTGGHYEKTVAELKNLVDWAWDLTEEEAKAEEEGEEEYDY